jgi:hypothetical protein
MQAASHNVITGLMPVISEHRGAVLHIVGMAGHVPAMGSDMLHPLPFWGRAAEPGMTWKASVSPSTTRTEAEPP